MKIKLNKKRTTKQEEIEIGERGDFILIKSKLRTYVFGKLERTAKSLEVKWKNPPVEGVYPPLQVRKGPLVSFKGDSYGLGFIDIMGAEIPTLKKRPLKDFGAGKYFDIRLIDDVVSGLDNIVAYLESQPDQRYRGHADLIRRIAEAQSR